MFTLSQGEAAGQIIRSAGLHSSFSFFRVWVASAWSFVAQGHDGIHAHRPPRGNVAGAKSYCRQQNGNSRKSKRIGCSNAVNHFGNQPCQPECGSNANGHSDQGHFHALSQNQDRKSTRLNSSHDQISYAVFCLKKKKTIKVVTVAPLAVGVERLWRPGEDARPGWIGLAVALLIASRVLDWGLQLFMVTATARLA